MKITHRLKHIGQGAKSLLLAGFIFVSAAAMAQTQNAEDNQYVKLGQKALLDGDFKAAVKHLEKGLPSNPGNPNIMYMIGYSEFQLGNYSNASKYFTKTIEKAPENLNAYYYRGKAKNTEAILPGKLNDIQREKLLQSSIEDYSKAISLNSSDMKYIQNRGIAYRDLGNLLGTTTSKNHDKEAAKVAYDNSIKDFKVVKAKNPNRKDMDLEIKKATVYRDNLK